MAKKKRYKNHYWSDEMDQWIAEYKQAETMEAKNKIFEEKLFQPFWQLANANVNRHTISRYNLNSIRDMTDLMVAHAVRAIDQYTIGVKSFPFFNVVMRNFLWASNRAEAQRVSHYPSREAMIHEEEGEEENGILHPQYETPASFFEDYVAEVKAYWDKYFSMHFPSKFVYAQVARLIVDFIFSEDWQDIIQRNSPKHTMNDYIRAKYKELHGVDIQRPKITKALFVIKRVNEELLRRWNNNEEVAEGFHFVSHIYDSGLIYIENKRREHERTKQCKAQQEAQPSMESVTIESSELPLKPSTSSLQAA